MPTFVRLSLFNFFCFLAFQNLKKMRKTSGRNCFWNYVYIFLSLLKCVVISTSTDISRGRNFNINPFRAYSVFFLSFEEQIKIQKYFQYIIKIWNELLSNTIIERTMQNGFLNIFWAFSFGLFALNLLWNLGQTCLYEFHWNFKKKKSKNFEPKWSFYIWAETSMLL